MGPPASANRLIRTKAFRGQFGARQEAMDGHGAVRWFPFGASRQAKWKNLFWFSNVIPSTLHIVFGKDHSLEKAWNVAHTWQNTTSAVKPPEDFKKKAVVKNT